MSLWSLSAIELTDALGSKHSYLTAELIICCCRAGSLVVEEWALIQPVLLPSCQFLLISWRTEDAFGGRQCLLPAYSQLQDLPNIFHSFLSFAISRKGTSPFNKESVRKMPFAGRLFIPLQFLSESSCCKHNCTRFLHQA